MEIPERVPFDRHGSMLMEPKDQIVALCHIQTGELLFEGVDFRADCKFRPLWERITKTERVTQALFSDWLWQEVMQEPDWRANEPFDATLQCLCIRGSLNRSIFEYRSEDGRRWFMFGEFADQIRNKYGKCPNRLQGRWSFAWDDKNNLYSVYPLGELTFPDETISKGECP